MGIVHTHRTGGWKHEIDDIIRGLCGGFLFGIPLLYTMEVWWIGSYSRPLLRMVAIAITFIVVFLLNRTEGFRRFKQDGLAESAMDSVEAIAIGLACTTSVLILLREITPDTQVDEALGKIILESVPFSLGVVLANQYLRGAPPYEPSKNQSDPFRQPSKAVEQDRLNATLSDLGATLVGAIIIAFNIAPTDEVSMLSAAISGPWLIALMATSLLISYGIVFQANFANQERRRQQQGIFERPMSETVVGYLVSLIAAALMLFFFQQLSLDDPWTLWLNHTLILGFPATIGGAAGRLLV